MVEWLQKIEQASLSKNLFSKKRKPHRKDEVSSFLFTRRKR